MCSTYKLATVNGLDMRSVYNCATDKKSDVQQTLDSLHLKCKKFTHNDKPYKVIKYIKGLMTDDTVSTSGLFRSVIFYDGKICAFSPPKSVCEEKYMTAYSPNDGFAEEFIEGTMINVFFVPEVGDEGDWEISTRSGVGGRMTYFQNGAIRAEDTFRYMFLDACSKANLVFDKLDRKYCYTFVMQHPNNRIVAPFYETNLFLVAAYQIDNEAYVVTEVPRQEQIDMVASTNVKIPSRFDFDSYDELRATWASGNTDYKTVGIMLKNKTTGERSKMRNPNYEQVRQLRGNQPKLQYHYIALRQQGKVGEYLKYFGEAKKPFSEFRKHIHTFTDQLHQNYIDCYVKKTKKLGDYPAQYKPHMYSLHAKYLNELCRKGHHITRRCVVDYVNGLPPARLMFTLNFSMRKRQVEEHVVDMVAE
jgi:hypothetical protein